MDETPQTAVSCRGLAKSFGDVQAVDGLDLDVERGSICALLGPSGCGKTTTLRLIAGFDDPDAGEISVGNRTVAGPAGTVPPERRRIGMVFQDYALFPHLDVAGNVAYGLGRRGDADRVREVLELVGLAGAADRPVNELSGGQQQRVAVARALAPTPELILLDEPFSNLDATMRDRLRRELREILKRAGVTSIFVTHDQEEALSLADSVAVMRDGRIEQLDTPETVYSSPATRWVARFVGDMEVLPGEARDGAVECELADLRADPSLDGPVDVLLRPESVGIAGRAPGARDEVTAGVVVGRRFYGHDQMVEVELPSGRRLHSRRLGFPTWHPGDAVHVFVDGPVSVLARES